MDKLKDAMGKGLRSVRYTSGEVQYQSVDDMRKILADMQRDIDAASGVPTTSRRVARYSRGF